jgi:dTDP-4-amino-4,6-dideoxygalactose transaminase
MYTSWPIGKVPKHLQRPELDQVKAAGYDWNDPLDVIDMFENKVAKFAGSKYAVAVDCCSHALFLSMKDIQRKKMRVSGETITIPKRTYISVPQQIERARYLVKFEDLEWSGMYQLKPFPIWDAAVRWRSGMYEGGYHCISFQIKKRIPIGKGGMILLNDKESYEYLKRIRYDGRIIPGDYTKDPFEYLGYHYYMTPEDAARGILLMDEIPGDWPDSGTHLNYTDVSKARIFK